MFLQQCSGILPITAYTVDIFHSAGTDINDNLSTIIVGGIQVVNAFGFYTLLKPFTVLSAFLQIASNFSKLFPFNVIFKINMSSMLWFSIFFKRNVRN